MVKWDTSEAVVYSAVAMGGNWSRGCMLSPWDPHFLVSGVLCLDHSRRLHCGWPGFITFTAVGDFFGLIKYCCSGDHQG